MNRNKHFEILFHHYCLTNKKRKQIKIRIIDNASNVSTPRTEDNFVVGMFSKA